LGALALALLLFGQPRLPRRVCLTHGALWMDAASRVRTLAAHGAESGGGFNEERLGFARVHKMPLDAVISRTNRG
jgi:hypothetical protein